MKTKTNTKTRISRLAAALLSAAVLGSALAPAAGFAAGADDGVRAAIGKDDKCKQIKNQKKRKRCVAKHETGHGPNHQ